MFLVCLMFILAIVVPFGLKLADLPPQVARPILFLVVGVALAIVVVSVAWRLVFGRPPGAVRPVDAKRAAALKWPRRLNQVELDGYCTAYLRAQGWAVAVVVSNEAAGTFLQARRDGLHVLLRCDPGRDPPRAADIRSVAMVARTFGTARPAILRQAREPFPSVTAAAARAVRGLLLHVPDLARLAEMAADAAPAAEPHPQAAEPAGAAPRP